MTFSTFAQYLQQLETISSRLEITAVLATLYKELAPAERQVGSYLLQGSLVPEYVSLEFQLSTKMIMRALATLRQRSEAVSEAAAMQMHFFGQPDPTEHIGWVEDRFCELGDLGEVAKTIVIDYPEAGSELTVLEVYEFLTAIAKAGGRGSQEQKVKSLVALLSDLDPTGAKYVVRIILNKLRLGFATMTILDALSWAVHGTKQDHAILEEAYQKQADIGRLAQVYLAAESPDKRLAALEAYSVQAGVPVVPQLCQRLASPEEVIAKLGEVYVEPKYDGLRAQIHIFKGKTPPPVEANGETGEVEQTVADLTTGQPSNGHQVKVFTRSLEEVTDMFPEAVAAATQISAESVVLDGEAIGYDPATGELVPFQQTITRKRKHAILETAQTTPIKFFVYDVLSIDGQSLLDVPLHERKRRLRELFADSPGLTQPEFIITKDPVELQQFHERQLAAGLEGVVIKQVNSPYQSGRKGWYWVKLKELAGTRGKLTDTVDCIVMGYYHGQGKRTGFGIGAFLVGIRDGEQIKTIAKIGTGLSDEQFRELKTRCDALTVIERPPEYDVPKNLTPAVWVRPELVVEIAADELTKSPLHTAGVALRFPRLVRFRDDKSVEQVTSLSEVTGIAGKPTDNHFFGVTKVSTISTK